LLGALTPQAILRNPLMEPLYKKRAVIVRQPAKQAITGSLAED